MIRGGIYHRVLQRTFEELRGRLTQAQLPNARSIALGELRAACAAERLSGRDQEHASLARALEADVLRYLAFAAASGTVFRPAHFELSFGTSRDDVPPVALGDDLRVSGRIDRVDVSPDGTAAIVVDYKGKSGVTAQARWACDGNLQVGLYALALRELLPEVRVVGALYQPITGKELRPRGYLEQGEDPDRVDIVKQRPPRARRGGRAARPRPRHRRAGGRRAAPRRGPAAAGRLRVRRRRLRAPVDLPVRAVSGGPDRALLEDASGHPIGPNGRPLTAEQADVVLHRDGPLMVAANAGSGKTTVLVERFVRHVVDDEIDPRAILAITFTRRAAGQLRERIRARLLQIGCAAEAQAMEAAWISTIDGFCLRVLSSHAVVAGLDPALTVLDPAELRPLREQAWEEAVGDAPRHARDAALGGGAGDRRPLRLRHAARAGRGPVRRAAQPRDDAPVAARPRRAVVRRRAAPARRSPRSTTC